MAIVAKFKLVTKVARFAQAFTEEHFAEDSPCRVGVGYNQALCTHGYDGSINDFTFVAANAEANAMWSAATPDGALTMTIANPAAIRQLEVGAIYTLTIQRSRSGD